MSKLIKDIKKYNELDKLKKEEIANVEQEYKQKEKDLTQEFQDKGFKRLGSVDLKKELIDGINELRKEKDLKLRATVTEALEDYLEKMNKD